MTRLTPEHRRLQILTEGQKVARNVGLFNERFTISKVAYACGCSPATVSHYFTGRNVLRDSIVDHSLEVHSFDKEIVKQAIAVHHPATRGMTL